MKKMQPVKISQEDSRSLQEQLGVQEISKGAPKSADPVNFPVFSFQVKKYLVYVPNHVVLDEDGVPRLRMDKPLVHPITIGKKFYNYRCIQGIKLESAGLSGACPICEASPECWDLANKIIANKCAQQGLDPANVEDKSVKAIRSATFDAKVIKDPIRYYTFPIVLFETVKDEGSDIVMDEKDGKQVPRCKIMWYSCSDKIFEEKWLACIAQLNELAEDNADVISHIGGRFYLLDYTYTPKSGEPNVRDAARALKVKAKRFKGSEPLMKQLDKLSEDWTPEKAQETVLANIIYSEADLSEMVDEVMVNTRNLLSMYETGDSGVAGIGQNAGYTLEQISGQDEDAATPGDVGEVDLPMEGTPSGVAE